MSVTSTLEILITPTVLSPRLPMFSYPTLLATQPDLTEKTSPAHPLLTETNKLTLLLPPNVVLPTSSLSIVGMYRVMLVKSYQASMDCGNREGHLPQTGNLHFSSALLSGFPRLLADQAAYRVLMSMWSKEAPLELMGKQGKEITVGLASTNRATELFKEVVLRVWRASNSPDAMPNKLRAVESIEDLYKRYLSLSMKLYTYI
jgi:hypothetical protein